MSDGRFSIWTVIGAGALGFAGGFGMCVPLMADQERSRATGDLVGTLREMEGEYTPRRTEPSLELLFRKSDPELGKLKEFKVLGIEKGSEVKEFEARVELTWERGKTVERFISANERRFAFGYREK